MPSDVQIRSVSKTFGTTHALKDVSLDIRAGEFVALIGPSGCGKTTLLRMLADLERQDSGEISVDGQTPAQTRRAHRLGLVSQRPAVLPWLSAERDVAFTQRYGKRRSHRPRDLLKTFGLGQHVDKLPRQLSGGMVQRVNFAAAIAHDPDLLLMDEPFSALDEFKREELGQWLSQQLVASPKTVVFVTHHLDEALMLADRVVLMSPSPGRIVDVFELKTPRPRGVAFRRSPEFVELAAHLRGELIRHAAQGDAA